MNHKAKSIIPFDIVWDKQTISRFWNRIGSDANLADFYFTRQKGASLLRFVKRYIPLQGRVLDLGCGPGYLIEHLLALGISCEGADLSEQSVQYLNERLAHEPLFKGAKASRGLTDVPVPCNSVDTLLFLETLEHLLPDDRDAYLANIAKSLVSGGHLVLTVPFAEDLDAAKVTCPDCGCRFHRVQHLVSFTPTALQGLLTACGFRTIVCRPVFLAPDWRVYLRALRRGGEDGGHCCPACGHSFQSQPIGFLRSVLGKLRPNKVLRLVYIGQRKDA